MARINYKVDQSLAAQGLLRVAVVAKALKIAPKTVNAWTKYHVSKIGGVKYLNWHEVVADKPDAQLTYGLSNAAMDVYASHVLLSDPQKAEVLKPAVVIKTNDAIARAKALLMKLPQNELVKEWAIETLVPATSTFTEPAVTYADEILTVKTNEESDLLTIHPDYKHLLRKVK